MEFTKIDLARRRRREERGIHPGAHVGADLALWLDCVAFIVVLFTMDDDFPTYMYPWDEAWSSFSVAPVALAIMCALLLLHFVLFVRACVETDQRNRKGESVSQVVYVSSGGGQSFYVVQENLAKIGHDAEAPGATQQDQEQAPMDDDTAPVQETDWVQDTASEGPLQSDSVPVWGDKKHSLLVT